MDDNTLSEHPEPVEFLNVCLSDNLQPHPGVQPRETSGRPDPPGPLQELTWASDPSESTGRRDAPAGGSRAEPEGLGSGSSQGGPQQNPSSSTQVVFWAGILQAQMCVLDLEEELEKTEGLRAELRSCIPTAPVDLPPFLSSPAAPLDPGPPASPPSGEDSSRPEGESQTQVSPGEGTPDSSPEWGAEEESLFFDNPLFLESPGSETSAPRERFSWGHPDSCADEDDDGRPESPQTLEPPLLLGRVPWGLGDEPDSGDSTAESSGHTTPPFPVPTYKPHSFSWAEPDSAPQAPAAPPCWAGSEGSAPALLGSSPQGSSPGCRIPTGWANTEGRGVSLLVILFPLPPLPFLQGSWIPCASHQALPRPEGGQTEQGPSWPQVPPTSQDRGSPQPQGCHPSSAFPTWTLDTSRLALLETQVAQPRSSETEEASEAPDPGEVVKSEGPAGTAHAGVVQPDAHLASTGGLPESPVPQGKSPEEGQGLQAADKLANGVRTDKRAWDLASRLYRLEGFRKSEVAVHLRKNNDFSRAVAQEYLSFFQFGGQSLDRALRSFLQALVLSGETQERERVLFQFSRRFHHCNPGLFSSVDSVHTLTCAIMLLNTDLHGQNIGKSMSCQEFISNLNGLQDGGNFPKELLKTEFGPRSLRLPDHRVPLFQALYWSIRSEKLEWAVDEEDTARPEKARSSPVGGKMSSPFLQPALDPTGPTYKQGILARKMHHDVDGKKTPWGKRGWKMLHTLLRGMVLYFLKGEDHSPEGESLMGQMVDEPVGVHHSLATPATHYTKKPHVFQLRTADWRLYLFQAPTAKEMSSWIARINLAAATHSAPPFPAAEEQHRSHENCLDAASDDLLDLQRNLPERRGRSRELEEYRLRKEYLEHEKTRYEMYVQLLMTRLHCPSDDLDLWEEQLGREAAGTQEPKPSLKKSHSSPSLHQDEAPTTAKVKRNISERRTYRKIIPKRNRHQL
ncbi:PH and SEC7 domain-containing protein 4 [Myotis davidii]|uniref:PH and SEC7 domain-containing protein 4 n=1 Tax=Myotis davidii TaxID=225400 RepID=L5LF60_MYODS|nr:PH and SEC7 domain-containing protein 4 [Myotis davidii]